MGMRWHLKVLCWVWITIAVQLAKWMISLSMEDLVEKRLIIQWK